MNFTTADYVAILDKIRETGHSFLKFTDDIQTDKFAYLRHDIDFSLEDALRMAKVENEMGVSSTYFTLLTAPYYNPLSEEGGDILKEIVSLGHVIGLHYDAAAFGKMSVDQARTQVGRLAQLLGDHIGQDVKCIAQHKPASSDIHLSFPKFVDAYENRFFSDIPYVSDSRKMFRVDDIFEFVEQTPKFQILIHPLWWTDKPLSRQEIFKNVNTQNSSRLDDLFAGELASIENFLKKYYSDV